MNLFSAQILSGTIALVATVVSMESSCAKPAPKPLQPPAASAPSRPASGSPDDRRPSNKEGAMQQERILKIEATTVGNVNNWTVTVANIMRKDKWKGDDGVEREGPTAEVGLYDEKEREQGRRSVGVGAVLTINGERWTVSQVQPGGAGDNGFVELSGPRAR